jgi:hypothetical protein
VALLPAHDRRREIEMTVYARLGGGLKMGIGFGTALAIAISYVHNQSILWAILHGLLSWFYVIYAGLFY